MQRTDRVRQMRQRKQLYDRAAAGLRIRGCRERLGISRQEMAQRIGKAEKYYADIERGYCGMSLDTMIDIADSLGLTLDYLVRGREPDSGVSQEAARVLFYLEGCSESRQKKAAELLKVYLSE